MNRIINNKIKYLGYIIIFIFLFMAISLFKTIIVDRDKYVLKLDNLTNIIVNDDTALRGRIYDRNYKLLVDNVSVPLIVYKKNDNLSKKDEINLAYSISSVISLDYSKVSERNIKEFYLEKADNSLNNKISEEEWDKLERRELNNNDIYNLKISRITDEELNSFNDNDRMAAYIYYLMNNGYSYSEKIIKSNATDEEYSYISENIDNLNGFYTKITWKRDYKYGDTLKGILGSVGLITKENKDYYIEKGYSLNDKVGLSFIEKQYDDILRGVKATYLKTSSTSLEKLTDEVRGNDIVLTIDIDLQMEVDKILKEELLRAKGEANTNFFNKSYAIIQEPNTGEILAISGVQIIKTGNNYTFVDVTSGVVTDPMTVGSVIKGASMIVGYNTGVIQIGEKILDECIKIKSSKEKCSSHYIGLVNDLGALKESSNVYQFKIAIRVGGGYYRYNQPLSLDMKAFDIYRDTFKEFGLGVKTGIDLPIESLGYSGSKRDTNLLLNFSIGQYDTYTPIQLSQYITTIASNGNRLQPHLLKEVRYSSDSKEIGVLKEKIEPVILNKVNTKDEYLNRVIEGFKLVVKSGTGAGVMGNLENPAGKTGTSESFIDTNNDGVIDTSTVSNAFVGFAPADNPKISITVTSPDVENPNTSFNYRTYANRRMAKRISNYYAEHYNFN